MFDFTKLLEALSSPPFLVAILSSSGMWAFLRFKKKDNAEASNINVKAQVELSNISIDYVKMFKEDIEELRKELEQVKKERNEERGARAKEQIEFGRKMASLRDELSERDKRISILEERVKDLEEENERLKKNGMCDPSKCENWKPEQ